MNRLNLYKKICISAIAILPLTAYAAGASTFSDLVGVIVSTLVNSVAALLISIAAAAFFFGIVRYIIGLRQGDPNVTKQGNDFIVWSLVALFVMFSIYGIIKFAQGFLFNEKNPSTITIPNVNLH